MGNEFYNYTGPISIDTLIDDDYQSGEIGYQG